jgi:Reverse transcriptase (RNA-dependent DNA polymerase)
MFVDIDFYVCRTKLAPMTIYKSLLEHGYFPKELPPNFYTEQFASFATTVSGNQVISGHHPTDNYTECFTYQLAQPHMARELRIPNPASFASLAELVSRRFSRLLKLAGRSKFARSRPVFATGRSRAIRPMLLPTNLARERAAVRAGSSYLLKADISHFYPSLYTHAVGWAIDPRLRLKANWNNPRLLGKKIDQYLMNLDGKVSQGIPIGNDISFLLSEIVLADVDSRLRSKVAGSFRWFDDYEFASATRDGAEKLLKKLRTELGRYRLRLNSAKTQILKLPATSQDAWVDQIRQAGQVQFRTPNEVVRYFDVAFTLHGEFPNAPVLLQAVGTLFKVTKPRPEIARIAESCLTQTVLAEPGSAQKVFALLSFWRLNGLTLNSHLLTETINEIVLRHQAGGFSSDLAWALFFCLEHRYQLSARASRVLSEFNDDCIAIQALHMHAEGLLPKGFSTKQISKALSNADLDREHWLLAYESVRHGFLTTASAAVQSNTLFSELLTSKVTFYRKTVPSYASIIHPGGAPSWFVREWFDSLRAKRKRKERGARVVDLIGKDIKELKISAVKVDDAIRKLLNKSQPSLEIQAGEGTAEATYGE